MKIFFLVGSLAANKSQKKNNHSVNPWLVCIRKSVHDRWHCDGEYVGHNHNARRKSFPEEWQLWGGGGTLNINRFAATSLAVEGNVPSILANGTKKATSNHLNENNSLEKSKKKSFFFQPGRSSSNGHLSALMVLFICVQHLCVFSCTILIDSNVKITLRCGSSASFFFLLPSPIVWDSRASLLPCADVFFSFDKCMYGLETGYP